MLCRNYQAAPNRRFRQVGKRGLSCRAGRDDQLLTDQELRPFLLTTQRKDKIVQHFCQLAGHHHHVRVKTLVIVT